MWFVYFKELKELIRDKKTLFFVIFLPLLIFPLLFFILGGIVASITIDQQQQVLKYHLVNANSAPGFAEMVKYHRDFTPAELKLDQKIIQAANLPTDEENKTKYSDELIQSITTAIQLGKADIIIVINPVHLELVKSQQQDQWQVYYNNAAQFNFVASKFNKVFQSYSQQISKRYLEKIKVSEQSFKVISTPIVSQVVNTASERENIGEKIGGILPYLLIMLCLTGAMYPAIDIGAGEKERNTLETLLLSSLAQHHIILGKFFTIMTTGVVTALISVFSLLFWGSGAAWLVNYDVASVSALFQLSDMLIILMMMLPISAFFASILLAISIYARSFKEAQNYMGLVTMLAFFPVMLAMLPGVDLNTSWAFVPITNVALAIKELIKGTVDYTILTTIFLSTIGFAIASVMFCLRWFKKESVLFR